MAYRRRYPYRARRSGGAGYRGSRFAGSSNRFGKTRTWVGLNQPAVAYAPIGAPSLTVDGSDYTFFNLSPTAALGSPGRAGTQTVTRIVGTIKLAAPENSVDAVPDFNFLPCDAFLFLGRLSRTDTFATTIIQDMLPINDQQAQDDNRIMWQRTYTVQDTGLMSDNAGGFFRSMVHDEGHTQVDVKSKRRIDFSQYGLGLGLRTATGAQGLTSILIWFRLRGLFLTQGGFV